MSTKTWVRVVVPVCIVLAVAGIWFIKNTGKETAAQERLQAHEDFVLEATAIDLEKLNAYGLPVIIDFGADSCIPCKEMAPVLRSLNSRMQGKAIIKFVDVWKYGEAANGFPIQVIPTQVFFTSDGKPYVPGDDVAIEFAMYKYRDTGEHAFTVHQGGLTEEQMLSILADMGVS